MTVQPATTSAGSSATLLITEKSAFRGRRTPTFSMINAPRRPEQFRSQETPTPIAA
ncbi:hypothetical protein [Jiangella aurantiaca]|uniref:hypothetical protein n=1 Tax=Jiangella aurantiaca TaxID=2530373 RepID=UPI0013A5CB49|nr:hypothetical protein [Jiangella aurantiaca]